MNPRSQPSVPRIDDLPSPKNPTIEAVDIAKSFGSKTALKGVGIRIEPGAIVGVVGPNGAGKTTLLQILCGILKPDRGSIKIHGINVTGQPERIRGIIAYLPEEADVMDYLTVEELLMLTGAVHGLSKLPLQRAIGDLLALWDLSDSRHQFLRNLSHGMKQRVLITVALLPSSDILLLDDPLNGLDLWSCAIIKDLIRKEALSGKAIAVSSHNLSLIREICRSVLILSNGMVSFSGEITLPLDVSLEQFIFSQVPAISEPCCIAEKLYATLHSCEPTR